MTTEFKSPTTDELFSEPSPEPEVDETSPDKEGEADKEKEEAVESDKSEDAKDDSKDKEADKASPDAKDDPSGDDDDTTDWKKRYEETQKWGNEHSTKAAKLDAELRNLKKEHNIDDSLSDDEIQANLNERIRVSEAIERRMHGNEKIDDLIYKEDAPWQSLKLDPVVDFRVRNSESPISEALKIISEHEFTQKYGTDPEKIREAIGKELETKLRTEIKKEIQDKLKQKKNLGDDLSGVKSDEGSEDKAFKESSTQDLFG